jgi:four helix bundle protein
MAFNSFEEMPVWQKAMKLADAIFSVTESLPKKEDYGLTSQIRRAALSVSGNIAEGFGRKHTKDKLQFYYASRGSLLETKNALIYGQRVGYFSEEVCNDQKNLIDETWKDLNALIRTLHKRTEPKP